MLDDAEVPVVLAHVCSVASGRWSASQGPAPGGRASSASAVPEVHRTADVAEIDVPGADPGHVVPPGRPRCRDAIDACRRLATSSAARLRPVEDARRSCGDRRAPACRRGCRRRRTLPAATRNGSNARAKAGRGGLPVREEGDRGRCRSSSSRSTGADGTSWNGTAPAVTPARVTRSPRTAAHGEREGTAAGLAQRREPAQAQPVGDRGRRGRDRGQPERLWCRLAVAGPVEGDQADAALAAHRVGEGRLQPARGSAVEVHEGTSARVTRLADRPGRPPSSTLLSVTPWRPGWPP